jgi:hypothetical protein
LAESDESPARTPNKALINPPPQSFGLSELSR